MLPGFIEASTIVNAGAVATCCYSSSGPSTREIQVTICDNACPPAKHQAKQVCFSGSILLETFDIEVVSYDGNLSMLQP